MAKQATKTALEKVAVNALAKLPDVDSFQLLLDSIPRYNEIKSRTGTEQAILAADDFHSGKLDGLQFLAAAVNAAEAFTKIILDSKAYVNKYRDMFKINSSMSKQHPDRMKWTALGVKTFRDFGIEVPEGITYTANGKEVAVTSDDPIGWTNFCYVVVKRSPQHVNNKFAETSKTIGSTYLPEPESHPSPIPTNIAAPVTPPPTGVTTSYKLVPDTDDDEEVEDDETLLNKLGDRLGNTPAKAMMPVPVLKTGDIDALINFLNADTVIGAVTPMDAVFGELSDFDLAKKAEQLARKIVEQNGTKDVTFTVKVTAKKVKKVDEPIDPEAKTLADDLAAEQV